MNAVIVGGGWMGVEFHLPRLSRLCGASAITIVETDARRLGELRERFRRRNDITLVSDLPVDGSYALTVVATPARFHAEYVDRLADRSATIVVETPLGRSLAESEAVVERLERSRATTFVCYVRRGLSSVRFVKQVLAAGLLGDLESVTVNEAEASGAVSLGPFRRDLNGGGVLVDPGAQTLDLLVQIFGNLTLRRAWIDADFSGAQPSTEANCVLELQTEGGIPVHVALSRNRHLSNKGTFRFARGVLTLDTRDNTLDLATHQGSRVHAVPACGSARAMTFDDLFDVFYRDRVVPGMNQSVTPRDSLMAARIIEDAYRSASVAETGF